MTLWLPKIDTCILVGFLNSICSYWNNSDSLKTGSTPVPTNGSITSMFFWTFDKLAIRSERLDSILVFPTKYPHQIQLNNPAKTSLQITGHLIKKLNTIVFHVSKLFLEVARQQHTIFKWVFTNKGSFGYMLILNFTPVSIRNLEKERSDYLK